MGPLLVPGVVPGDRADEPEPAAAAPEPVAARLPQPGGDLGAAVAAALQAALERTGEAPPAPVPPAHDLAEAPTPTEPLDLLDTSSAPWLRDPELGVQWAESWIASVTGDQQPELQAPVTGSPVRKEPATALPFTFDVEPPPPPELPAPEAAAPPPTVQLLASGVPPSPVSEPAAPQEPDPAARRSWVPALGLGLVIGLLAGLVAYAVGPAASKVHLRRYDVPVTGLPAALEGLRIVQVSDLHLPGKAARADSAARLVVRARPDVVLLTGDIIDDAAPATIAALDRFLATARGGQGTFAVTGEREAQLRAPLQRAYQAHGVRLLANQRAALPVGDAYLIIAGLDGAKERLLHVTPAGAGSAAAVELARPRVEVLMIHAPELLADVPRADLKDAAFVVAGHTLGGMLGLPRMLGGQSRYRSGWYGLDLTRLYVSNGVGTGRIPARLFAPAEVTRFTLRRASAPFAMPSRDTTRD